jgi:hypothetical protein
MRKLVFFLFIAVVTLGIPSAGFSYTFSDDFNDGNLDGWTPKIGSWSVQGTGDSYLLNDSSDYGVIWKDDSLGIYQQIQVNAYFVIGGGYDNTIAHLRLRTSDNGSPQQYWDTGYLAQFTPTDITILNTYQDVATITSHSFGGSSPIGSSGWYTLVFSVAGTGADTHFEAWINGIQYIDYNYNSATSELDSGYIGLGRLIRYDDAQGYSSNTPIPEPTTIVLLSLGLIGVAIIKRRIG